MNRFTTSLQKEPARASEDDDPILKHLMESITTAVSGIKNMLSLKDGDEVIRDLLLDVVHDFISDLLESSDPVQAMRDMQSWSREKFNEQIKNKTLLAINRRLENL